MADERSIQADPVDDNPDPSAWPVLFYGLVGTLVVVLSVLALEVLYGLSTRAEDAKKSNSLITIEMQKIRDEQGARIETYRWIDEQNGIAAIPIERAMELVIDEAAEARGK